MLHLMRLFLILATHIYCQNSPEPATKELAVETPGELMFTTAVEILKNLSAPSAKPEINFELEEESLVEDILNHMVELLFGPSDEHEPAAPDDAKESKDIHTGPDISDSDPPSLRRAKALQMLNAAGYGEKHPGALGLLGDIYLFKKYDFDMNANLALESYEALATLGVPKGHRMLGYLHALGIAVPQDYQKALVYFGFAAIGDDIQANQVLGYWHQAGIAVEQSCEIATYHYERVLDRAFETYESKPPGGLLSPKKKIFLPDKLGGIYGKEASGPGNPTTSASATNGNLRELDLVMLYRLQAESGDAASQFTIGQYYYQGSQSVNPDFKKALHFFSMAAKQHPGMHALQKPDVPKSVRQAASAASQAAGYLGQMFWRGEGVTANPTIARKWFERGSAQNGGIALNGLALMYQGGHAGLEASEILALQHFEQSALAENPAGMINLAKLMMKAEKPDALRIVTLVEKAAKKGHPVAQYELGNFYKYGYKDVVPVDCEEALYYFKLLAEKWSWHDETIQNGYFAFSSGDMEKAVVNYLVSAEAGFEISQVNAAWIIDSGRFKSKPDSLIYTEKKNTPWDPYTVALTLWNRAANQGHVDARVKVGDYFYYGRGFSRENDTELEESKTIDTLAQYVSTAFLLPGGNQSGIPDYAEAAKQYANAADIYQSSLAMYNLAYMYESGYGLDQDFFLAKRYYDLSLATNPGGYLPVTISNLRMQLKWAWDEYARPKPVKDDGDLPPLPIDDSELEEEAHSKTLEKIIFSAVFVIIGILFYLRGRVLNQLPLARQDRPVREAENAVAAEPQEAAHADQNARENNGILPNQQPPAPAGQEANV